MNQLHPTTAAVGSSASGVIIILWLVSLLPPSWHVTMTPEVAVALVGVLGGIVGAVMRRLAGPSTAPASDAAPTAPPSPAA